METTLLRPRERWRSIVMSMSVCLSVCLSVRQDISGTTRAIFTNSSVHVAYGHGSVLLRHGDEIPMGRGTFGGIPPHAVTMHCNAFAANNAMQQNGPFRSRPGGAGVMGMQGAGEVWVYDCVVFLVSQSAAKLWPYSVNAPAGYIICWLLVRCYCAVASLLLTARHAHSATISAVVNNNAMPRA